MKPVDHRTASGDRTVARLLNAALVEAGYDVIVASRLRSLVRRPDPRRMAVLRDRGEAIAANLVRHWRRLAPSERPAAWFTYHVYYKAVDWIGPAVARSLAIPYLIAEASHAPKRADGPWRINHQGAVAAIRSADAVLCLNPADKECLREITSAARLRDLPPFLDTGALKSPSREQARRVLAARHRLDPDLDWLLAVGMMRPGDKLASYQVLGRALKHAGLQRAALLVAGDGPARRAVKAALSGLPIRLVLAGSVSQRELAVYYAASDLMVWPAINEAFGMALLEAQAAGLPVVAGASGGVPAIVADGKTGLLARPGDAAAFASCLRRALKSDLVAMGKAAGERVRRRHSLHRASRSLEAVLSRLGVSP